MNKLYDLLETSRGPEARQRERALNFIGGSMSPVRARARGAKTVKITVTFRTYLNVRSKHRVAMLPGIADDDAPGGR